MISKLSGCNIKYHIWMLLRVEFKCFFLFKVSYILEMNPLLRINHDVLLIVANGKTQNPWKWQQVFPEMVSVKYSGMSVANLKKEMKDRRGIRSSGEIYQKYREKAFVWFWKQMDQNHWTGEGETCGGSWKSRHSARNRQQADIMKFLNFCFSV